MQEKNVVRRQKRNVVSGDEKKTTQYDKKSAWRMQMGDTKGGRTRYRDHNGMFAFKPQSLFYFSVVPNKSLFKKQGSIGASTE
jgi:hypothetical protein